jgi:predicted GH43/DUF377 family glycosyl hydrolase
MPSRPDFQVMCAFNPGATAYNGKTVLLLRVAERPIPEKGYLSTALLDLENPGQLKVMRVKLDDPDLQMSDPRLFTYKGELYLTSISHLRMATSDDGRHFTVEKKPTLMPANPDEIFGIEDPRMVWLDGWCYINYSSIAGRGITTSLARTRDFKTFERLGLIFGPDNKDIAFFPETIDGRYWCFHRPSMKQFGSPSIWLASSDNLLDWGRHHFLIGPRPGMWDCERVGCGAQAIRTSAGWLEMYHASDNKTCYCSAALLLDLKDPRKIIARSREPILYPSEAYEKTGLMPNVIFHSGLVERAGGKVDLYYGCTDDRVCGATMDVQAVLNSLL